MKTIDQVMTKQPTSCVASETVEKVAQQMKTEDVGSIPVIDTRQSNRLIGIVTDRDLVLKVIASGRDPRSTRVEEVMTYNPVTCRETQDVQTVMDTMSEYQIRRIPVLDDQGRLTGIISQADLATRLDNPKKTAQVLEEISKPAQATVR
jgi:CBS domain-containing protein